MEEEERVRRRKEARKEAPVKVILALIQQIFFAHLLAGFKSSNSKILWFIEHLVVDWAVRWLLEEKEGEESLANRH